MGVLRGNIREPTALGCLNCLFAVNSSASHDLVSFLFKLSGSLRHFGPVLRTTPADHVD